MTRTATREVLSPPALHPLSRSSSAALHSSLCQILGLTDSKARAAVRLVLSPGVCLRLGLIVLLSFHSVCLVLNLRWLLVLLCSHCLSRPAPLSSLAQLPTVSPPQCSQAPEFNSTPMGGGGFFFFFGSTALSTSIIKTPHEGKSFWGNSTGPSSRAQRRVESMPSSIKVVLAPMVAKHLSFKGVFSCGKKSNAELLLPERCQTFSFPPAYTVHGEVGGSVINKRQHWDETVLYISVFLGFWRVKLFCSLTK